MPRLLFEKTGNTIWISHLDLMRMFHRAFKRADLPLTHTQGFNPRPSVSIALPMSVGIESRCELLDFELDGQQIPGDEIQERLNQTLVNGVKILDVYENGKKLRELAYLRCQVVLEYDNAVPCGAEKSIEELFSRESVIVPKKNKNGIQDQDIIPMIQSYEITRQDNELTIEGVVCCQNPTLNPMQLISAIEMYLPDLTPDFAKCRRIELYDHKNVIFR